MNVAVHGTYLPESTADSSRFILPRRVKSTS